MDQSIRNYKAAPSTQTFERWATPFVWLLVAALIGWAISLALGWFGDREVAKLPAWTPPPIVMDLKPRQSVSTTASANVISAPWLLVGIADDRIYVRSEGKPASFAEGETLPNGDVVKKIERDSVIVANKSGESRVALYKDAKVAAADGSQPSAGSIAGTTKNAPGCRLSAQDRVSATFIEAAVAAALMKETSAFNRMFAPLVAVGGDGGVRATGTGGITAAFGIQDGDTLFRAEGRAITSGQSVLNEVMARIQRGESVVVEGERGGAQRRWVFAPSSCRS